MPTAPPPTVPPPTVPPPSAGTEARVDRTVAGRLAALVGEVFGGRVPIRIRAWDGNEAGPTDAPVVVIRKRTALRRLLWDPNELGLARAYVSGEIDVEGELAEGLSRVWSLVRERPPASPGLRDQLRWAPTALRLGIVGRRPPAPPEEAVLAGEKHTAGRDSDAISYHYDQSNDLFAALLDEHMAYSCAYFREDPATDPGAADGSYTVTDAQRDKLELLCRKLGLQPGMRLLDIGCGWGSMLLYAAEHHGVHATGVTISAQQRDHIEKVVAERGLADRVVVRLQDYREVPMPPEGPYDAISSIEMSEHVGQDQYPTYAETLHRLVRPGGRVLVQAMSHPSAPGGGAGGSTWPVAGWPSPRTGWASTSCSSSSRYPPDEAACRRPAGAAKGPGCPLGTLRAPRAPAARPFQTETARRTGDTAWTSGSTGAHWASTRW